MLRLDKFRFFTLVMAMLLITVSVPSLYAQDNSVVLQVAVPRQMRDIITPDLLSQFETDNPGVNVNVVESATNSAPPASAGVDNHLQAVQQYASTADVLYVTQNLVTVQATRAGYFLDLSPLANADTSLNVDDFLPGMWESYQWDGGVWALPASADVITLSYDTAAFDKAGVAYPNEKWTIDDLANAVQKLAQTDATGKVTTPGLVMFGNYYGLLIRSLLGQAVYDSSVVPNAPSFNNPQLEALVTTLAQLKKDGYLTNQFSGQIADIPMRILGSFGFGRFAVNGPNATPPAGALLPGGKAGLNVQGFAISSGTQFQEQAYALAKYLTLRPEVANNFNSASPARKSLVGVQPTNNNNNGGGGGGGRAFRQTTPEQQALVQQALANGLPDSELRFTDYVATAVDKVNSENTDAHTALQEVEAQANTDLQTADSKKTSNSVVVATPVPEVVLPAGKIALKFAVQSFIEPLPNQDRWDQLIQNFVANDPQVGNVVLDTPGGFGGGGVDQLAQNYDCFYLAYNAVPSITLTSVLSLDPFIDADPTFDKSDVVNNVFPQLQRDNKTWALPIDLEPEGLRYDSDKFSRSNVPAPQDGWTVNAFNDALKALKLQPTDPAPFRSGSPGDTYLLMLMAAYGGLPIDYRTNPPTLNFTDQNNAQAIQQVLDLAKAGYLDYGALTARGDVVIFSGSTQQQADIYSQALNAFGFGLRFRAGGNNNRNQNGNATTTTDTYMLTTYPKGSQFGAATYNLGTGYISATSQNPEACYRWLNTVAHHPDLFSAMPARRSLFDDPTVTGSETPDAIAFYKEIDAVLQDANTITFPSIFGGASAADFLTRRWLDEAFDSYVLKDGDLTSGLSDAQTYATTYQQCTANIPPFDPSTENQRSYRQQIMACATKADPNAAALFGG